MTSGFYLYCIADTKDASDLGNIGLYEKPIRAITFKDISALVSMIPFKEIQPNVSEINWHQQVVETSRANWVTLPARFGTIFKSDEGVRNYLVKSYKDLHPKITKLKGKDEYGVKVIFDRDDLSKLKMKIGDSNEIKKIRKELATAGEGTSYFLKLRIDDAIRNEVLKKIDEIRGDIHEQLSETAANNCIMRSDLDQIILNASYLVGRNKKDAFESQVKKIKEKYTQYDMMIHVSGPWAPYSFC